MILILDSKSTIFELVSVLSLISEMDGFPRGQSQSRSGHEVAVVKHGSGL